MTFFVKLAEAVAANQSLLLVGLDPNPDMLQRWNERLGAGGSFMAQARRWVKAVVEQTRDQVCAYKPTLGFYQSLGPMGLDLLMEVRDLVPRSIPLILDAKHGDLNTSSSFAHYAFHGLGFDAVSLLPLAGQDLVAPFLLYPDRAVVVSCHSSNRSARPLLQHPSAESPFFLKLVEECCCWGTPEQLLLEVGTRDPDVLRQIRSIAPTRFMLLRSIWEAEERLPALLREGLNRSGDGLLLPIPQDLLVAEAIDKETAALRRRIEHLRQNALDTGDDSSCEVWIPAPSPSREPLDQLIVELFDIGCLMFGRYLQASGAVFNYYIDLRRIISNPNLFHRVLHAYAGELEALDFDRIAGIPYGSLPTATGLSLQLGKPLIYPRKEVKAHGARRLVEGDYEVGETVVVVDDIVISGGSVLEGIEKLESSGLEVRDVVVFLDHESGARERLATAGYGCHAVMPLSRITAVLTQEGRLDLEQLAVLRQHNASSTVSEPPPGASAPTPWPAQ